MDSERLVEILEGAGAEVRSYSGRGMYGAQCVAFTVEAEQSLLGVVAEVVAANAETGLEFEIARLFKAAKIDSMGLGTIVYFPSVKWDDDK